MFISIVIADTLIEIASMFAGWTSFESLVIMLLVNISIILYDKEDK